MSSCVVAAVVEQLYLTAVPAADVIHSRALIKTPASWDVFRDYHSFLCLTAQPQRFCERAGDSPLDLMGALKLDFQQVFSCCWSRWTRYFGALKKVGRR